LGEFGQQLILFGAIFFALVFWVWGKLRYDVVALIALAIITIGGVISFETAFTGFSNPAVIIVVAVLVMSKGIKNTGFINFLINKLPIKGKPLWFQIAVLSFITALLAPFVYNIGALAITMPLAVSVAKKKKISPAFYLIPIAFAAHLGGFITIIGNAANLIVSSFRVDFGMEPFGMFDFAHVGIWISLAALLFIIFIGWRLIPERKEKKKKEEVSEIKTYTSELIVPESSDLIGKTLEDLKEKLVEEEFKISAVIRDGKRMTEIENTEMILEKDIIMLKADAETIKQILSLTDFKLKTPKEELEEEGNENKEDKDVKGVEAVVAPSSRIIGFTLEEMKIDFRYDIEVAAISRHDQEIKEKLKSVEFKVGDVLLLRGNEEDINEFMDNSNILPLADKDIRLTPSASMAGAFLIFLISVLFATFNILPIGMSFFLGAVAMVSVGILSPKEAYENIDWSIAVILGAMIPFGEALVTSGAADLISTGFLDLASGAEPITVLALVLGFSIIMSDFVNNVGVAVLMAPISILIAQQMGVSPDPFLMAVAIAGSCAFLTPVGHQANLLVMKPGGYEFTDYWKAGIFLDIIIFAVSIVLLPVMWPF